MKYNKIKWHFVLRNGSIMVLSWWTEWEDIKYYIESFPNHWVTV